MLPPFFSPAKISSGGVKLKSLEHHYDFLLARAIALVMDDQRASISDCSCSPDGVHPNVPPKPAEVVIGAAARWDRGPEMPGTPSCCPRRVRPCQWIRLG